MFPTHGHTRTRGMFARLDSPDVRLRITRFVPEPRAHAYALSVAMTGAQETVRVHDDKPYAGLVARVTGPWLELRRAGVVRESEVHVHVQDEGAAAGPNNLAMHLEFCSRQYGGALCTCGWEPIE